MKFYLEPILSVRFFTTLLLIFLGAFALRVHALPIIPESSFYGVPIVDFYNSNSSYDADADLFTARLQGATGSIPSGTGDFSGTFTLTATVNEVGGLLGGIVSWTGGSSDLGIPSGTTLLTGTITDFTHEIDSNWYGTGLQFVGFQFLINVVYADASLGFGQTAGLTLFHEPFLYDINGDLIPPSEWFHQDFVTRPYTHDTLVNIVPEPTSIMLLFVGLIGIFYLPRSKSAL